VGGLAFWYQVVDYTSGDVLATCSVSDASSQYSSAMYYLDGQVGTLSATCLVTYDVDTFTGGYWEFRADSPGERAIYRDASSASNGSVVSLVICIG
jgi:hypothetical protein